MTHGSLSPILKQLHQTQGWRDFTLRRTLAHDAQVYAVENTVETLRCQGQVNHQLTVYVDRGNGRTGQSGFSFGADFSDFKPRLVRALQWAALVDNPAFALPDKTSAALAQEKTVTPPSPQNVLNHWRRLSRAAQAQKGVRMAQSELWQQKALVSVLNSRGVVLHEPREEWMVEFTVVAGDARCPREETECFFATRRRLGRALELENWVAETAHVARELRRAALPPSGRRDVVLGGVALDTLFDFFTGQGGAQARFEGWSGFATGEPVFKKMEGDPLYITVDPRLPGAMGSRRFDSMGCLLKPFALIDNNRFVQHLAPKPWADYAGVPVTGEASNLVVAPGTGRAKDWLKEDGLLVLTDFSTIQPNEVTGAFSAEIRFGHYLKNGKRIPVKGGSITGLLPQAFRHLRLSRETVQREFYHGPAYLRLGGVTVAG